MNQIKRKRQEYLLPLAVFALTTFGLIMIYSVSKYYSLQLTDGETDKYFLKKQLISTSIALLVWAVTQTIDYRYWQKKSGAMLFVTLILLGMPLVFGGGSGARWMEILGQQFQPSEIAKLAFIFYVSGWFASKGDNIREAQKLFMPFMAAIAIIAGLMLIQKDLGTLSIFVAIASVMLVIAGSSFIHLAGAGGLAALLLWVAVKLEPYRLERVLTFLNPEDNLLSTGYHIRNALIAIGSGGLLGLGFGQSRQKYLYLPEAHTDSIFAIISEELGLVRSAIVLILFMVIALRGYKVAANAPDLFSRLAAVGITTWISTQAFVNIAAMLSIVPLTGIPLPFVSYGGTSLIFLMAGVGVLSNISKNQRAA